MFVLPRGLKRISLRQQILCQARQLSHYVDDSLVGDLVVHEQALALHFHQETASQLLEVMGHERLRQTKLLHYGGNGFSGVAQGHKDSEAVLIGKAFADKRYDTEAGMKIRRGGIVIGRHLLLAPMG